LHKYRNRRKRIEATDKKLSGTLQENVDLHTQIKDLIHSGGDARGNHSRLGAKTNLISIDSTRALSRLGFILIIFLFALRLFFLPLFCLVEPSSPSHRFPSIYSRGDSSSAMEGGHSEGETADEERKAKHYLSLMQEMRELKSQVHTSHIITHTTT
jgi:hypothetical protein